VSAPTVRVDEHRGVRHIALVISIDIDMMETKVRRFA
jgi:hypothetical protein